MTVEPEHDYKAAYEILLRAVQEADHVLRRANLRVQLRMEREAGLLGAEDEEMDKRGLD